jgi:hypothetical protein
MLLSNSTGVIIYTGKMETYTHLPNKKNTNNKNKQKPKQKDKKQTKRYCVTFLDHLICVFIHTVLY